MKKYYSSSIMQLSGDNIGNKNLIYRIAYLLGNFFENFYGNFFSIKKGKLHEFKITDSDLINIKKSNSFARIFSDIFWRKVDWTDLKKKLGHLYINDIGCGKGQYALFFSELIKNKFNYTGYDIKKYTEWDVIRNQNIKFSNFDGINFHKIFEKNQNIFLSQSCIEHIKYDLKYFNELRDHLVKNPKKVKIIHLFPSSSCLYTYLWHGYRQYNSRNINSICEIFNNFEITITKLGKGHDNFIYFKYSIINKIFNKLGLKNFYSKKNYYEYIDNELSIRANSKLKNSCFIALEITNF